MYWNTSYFIELKYWNLDFDKFLRTVPFPFFINSQRYNNTMITIYTFKIPDFEEDTRCQYLLQNHYFHNVDI